MRRSGVRVTLAAPYPIRDFGDFRGVAEIDPLPNSYRYEAIDGATERARGARSAATRRAYRSDWDDFLAFCDQFGAAPDPSSALLAVYLDQLARRGSKISSLRRRIAAINAFLRSKGQPALSLRDEPLASVWRGLQRDVGAPPRQARALEISELRAVVQACDDSLAGRRDRALLLLGFAGGFRRSELIGLHWSADTGGDGYLRDASEGVRVMLRRSKTNQLGAVEEVAICRGAYAATCPVQALEAWRDALSEATGAAPSGPVFRAIDRHGRCSARGLSRNVVRNIICRAVTRQARAAGADDVEIAERLERLSGHSLRAGLVTTAFAAGISAEDVMRQTRHRDIGVLLAYRRHATAFVGNVSGRVGL